MLDLGFLPDVERILRFIPDGRQTMLFSATMPGPVISLARQYMTQPTHIRAHDPEDAGLTVANVEQHVFRAHALDKVEMLARILQAQGRGQTMVFCRTKRTAQKVSDELADARLRLRGRPRRPRPGCPRAGAARVPQRQGRRPRRDRRGRPRHRRRGRHARHQLPVPRGREDLPAPDRAYGSRRRVRHRGHVRRLGRHPPLDAHQQGARAGLREPGGDVLHLRPLLRGAGHPARTSAASCPRRHVRPPASRPRRSRTSARPARPTAPSPRPRTPRGRARPLAGPAARSGGDKGSRGSDRGSGSSSADATPRPARTRTSGQRTRTRGGAPVDASANGSPNGSGPSTSTGAGSDASGSSEGAPGRRRRRGGRGKGKGAAPPARRAPRSPHPPATDPPQAVAPPRRSGDDDDRGADAGPPVEPLGVLGLRADAAAALHRVAELLDGLDQPARRVVGDAVEADVRRVPVGEADHPLEPTSLTDERDHSAFENTW